MEIFLVGMLCMFFWIVIVTCWLASELTGVIEQLKKLNDILVEFLLEENQE